MWKHTKEVAHQGLVFGLVCLISFFFSCWALSTDLSGTDVTNSIEQAVQPCSSCEQMVYIPASLPESASELE